MDKLKMDEDTKITVIDQLNEYRLSVDRCHGLRGQDGKFCENFGCDNIIELLDMIDALQSQLADAKAENERLKTALQITKSHASDIRMTNIGFKPNGYDVVKTGQSIEDIAEAALKE